MISIIGPGKMGQAMADQLQDLYEVQLCGRGEEPQGEVVIFAVKPQDFATCIEGLPTDLSERLIISIMAGISLEKLTALTGSKRVVRSLPNLPLQVAEGYTLWVSECEDSDKTIAQEIFQAFGDEVEVKSEQDLNTLGVLSGCGPAFFFHLTELIEEQAKAFGLSEEQASQLARQTCMGSATLLTEHTEKTAAQWREAVCSKGGITIAALEKMWELGLKEAFTAGCQRAVERTEELNS